MLITMIGSVYIIYCVSSAYNKCATLMPLLSDCTLLSVFFFSNGNGGFENSQWLFLFFLFEKVSDRFVFIFPD
jgi:hypothetical protein